MVKEEKWIALVADCLRQYYPYTHTSNDNYQLSDFIRTMTGPGQPGSLHVLAIVFYGSCLNPETARHTSTPDYYLVVDQYRGFYHKRRHVILNRWLPPNIFRFKESKYSIISMADLQRETSASAGDLYNMGRFSKRIAIAYTASAKAYEETLRACASAMVQVTLRSLPLLQGMVDLDQIVFMALKLSYFGDVRVEADDKLQKIFQSEAKFYRHVYGVLVEALLPHHDWIRKAPSGNYEILPSDRGRMAARRFIRISRLRACLRWPKFAITIENWADYMIAKIERTQGVKIELTKRERRYLFFSSWKYIWRLKQRKLLK